MYAKTFLWTYIRFNLKKKISNIAFVEANVDVKNVIVEANFIITIDTLNLGVSDLFINVDGKINHLFG